MSVHRFKYFLTMPNGDRRETFDRDEARAILRQHVADHAEGEVQISAELVEDEGLKPRKDPAEIAA